MHFEVCSLLLIEKYPHIREFQSRFRPDSTVDQLISIQMTSEKQLMMEKK